MNERFSILLDELKARGVKQYAVAEALGVTETAVSAWRNGRRNLTEQTIKAICREFNVNYMWLTSGDGEMFIDTDDDIMETIDRIMLGENEFHKNLFKTFARLDEDELLALERIIDKFIEVKKEKD
jgi:transcriptional regulator with XRE-family HTH domain